MNITEIITDSLMYPINNINAILLYMVLGIVAALVLVFTGVGVVTGNAAGNLAAAGIVGFIGLIIALVLVFLISGYALDIVKYGINGRNDAPGIDFVRQIFNGIKLIIVKVVYFIIPLLITFVVGLFLAQWLAQIIGLILIIIFALAEYMAECRLAKTDQLNSALSIGDAIGDISRVGILKILVTVIIVAIISSIISSIVGAIAGYNGIIGGILFGICAVYLAFFSNRATGLLYSGM